MSNGIYELTGGRAATHPPQSPFRIFAATTTGREKNVIRQELVSIACWRLDDVRFTFGSSFVAPAARAEFEALARVCEAHATAPISVFGHADPVGEDKKNKILSGQRAEVIYAILTHDAERWERICKDAGWPATHMQEIAEALQFETIAAFQKANGLYEDGIAGPRTRAKLFPQYFDYLFPKALPQTAFLGLGASANGKGAYQGCGEFNPAMLFAKAENEEFVRSGNNAKRDEANAVNRRVIVLFFRPGTVIPGDKWPCPTATEGIDGCRRRFWSDGEKRRSFQENPRKFEESFDTFACRFYHRLVVSSPCESSAAPLLCVEVHIDAPPDTDGMEDSFQLFSEGGEYDSTLMRSDAIDYAPHSVKLVFTNVIAGKDYTLRHFPRPDAGFDIFTNIRFEKLEEGSTETEPPTPIPYAERIRAPKGERISDDPLLLGESDDF